MIADVSQAQWPGRRRTKEIVWLSDQEEKRLIKAIKKQKVVATTVAATNSAS